MIVRICIIFVFTELLTERLKTVCRKICLKPSKDCWSSSFKRFELLNRWSSDNVGRIVFFRSESFEVIFWRGASGDWGDESKEDDEEFHFCVGLMIRCQRHELFIYDLEMRTEEALRSRHKKRKLEIMRAGETDHLIDGSIYINALYSLESHH